MSARYAQLAAALLMSYAIATSASACLVCYRPPYQCLLEKVESSGQVIVARTINETRDGWQGTVVRVVKGNEVDVDQTVTISKLKSDRIATGDLQLARQSSLDGSWTILSPIDRELLEFLAGGVALSSSLPAVKNVRDQSQALRYFLPYLEHSHPQIADSAYSTIAKAPYEVLRNVGTGIKPDQLLAWIGDPRIAQKRKSLYITLLGICGGKREATLIKRWIDDGWNSQNTDHLAALLTAHAELNGEDTVSFIEQSYIQNRDRQLGELIAAINALRVHGQADGTISRSRIQASVHFLLRERPQLAELIIEDCARWKDWSIATKLMEIYASGEQPWNNAMIIKYLEACPLPAAKQFVTDVSATDARPN